MTVDETIHEITDQALGTAVRKIANVAERNLIEFSYGIQEGASAMEEHPGFSILEALRKQGFIEEGAIYKTGRPAVEIGMFIGAMLVQMESTHE